MRIGVVVPAYPTLSETFIRDHVHGLSSRGHEVTVIASLPCDVASSLEAVGGHERVLYRRDPVANRAFRAARVAAVAVRMLASGEFQAARALTRGTRVCGRDELASEIAALAEARELDLFHCHFGPVGSRLAEAMGALGTRKPIVTTFHGQDLTSHLVSLPDAYRNLFRDGARFLAVSELFRGLLVAAGSPPERTLVHRVGIDVDLIRPHPRLPSKPGHLQVLMAGRLVEKKGFEHGVRAIGLARSRGFNVEARIAGDGPVRARLDELIRSEGLETCVALLGAVDRNTILEEMAKADVLLAPSITAADGEMEGIPVVIMEAMASGLPVISTRHSGIPETVRDGSTGLLTDEGDEKGLAEQLSRMAMRPAIRDQIARTARAFVTENHSLRRQLDRVERIYASV